MNHSAKLIIASLLSILFVTFHLADDIVRGMEPGTASNLIALPILVLWLSGVLLLQRRRAGYVIALLGSLLGLFVPFVHMRGAGVGEIAKTTGGFFFVWTLLALGVTSLFAAILAIQGLMSRSRSSVDSKPHQA